MKAYDYEAVVFDDEVYCTEHLSSEIPLDDKRVKPIFADSEWDNYPICCICGYEHDYVTKLENENADQK